MKSQTVDKVPGFTIKPGTFSCPADLVFDPTLAFARFTEDLLLRYAMITARTPRNSLRGSFCPYLAWTCNHRPEQLYIILSSGYGPAQDTGANSDK